MRFRIDVIASKAPDGWRVTVQSQENGWSPPPARELPRAEVAGHGFPMPPAGTTVAVSGGALAGSVAEVAKIFQRIRDQQTQSGDLAAFGHYLFEMLLGPDLWKAMCAHAGRETAVDLEISLRAGDKEMMRLPWEALHDGKDFLILQPWPAVSVIRVVSGAVEGEPPTLELPLRVLFVVCASLKDKQLQPGAEYLGVMRSLRAEGLSLRSRLLLEANSDALEKSVRAFKPQVVHFIGHGGVDEKGGYIELIPTEGKGPRRAGAEDLKKWLCPDGLQPSLVVLNTCYSGSLAEGLSPSMPLTVELVEKGFPLVVGMAGRVLDTACRLFTREFYGALVHGRALSSAVSTARAAGLKHASDPDAVDWVLPVLVTAPLASMALAISPKPPESLRELEKRLRKDIVPAILCDRHEFLVAYQQLELKDAHKVLVALVQDPLGAQDEFKFGMTRLLQELAVQALDDGYLPCLATADRRSHPQDLLGSTRLILDSAKESAQELSPQLREQVSMTVFELDKLMMKNANNVPLEENQLSILRHLQQGMSPTEPKLLRMALRLDLLRLETMTGRRPLVLVDGLHWFSDVEGFLNQLQPQGLGEGETIPVILSCNMMQLPQASRDPLKTSLKRRSSYIRVMELAHLAEDDTEKYLVYLQLLLGWRGSSGQENKPLVISKKLTPAQMQQVINSLHNRIEGIPSRLTAEKTAIVIETLEEHERLLPANDEDTLEQWKQQQALRARQQGRMGGP